MCEKPQNRQFSTGKLKQFLDIASFSAGQIEVWPGEEQQAQKASRTLVWNCSLGGSWKASESSFLSLSTSSKVCTPRVCLRSNGWLLSALAAAGAAAGSLRITKTMPVVCPEASSIGISISATAKPRVSKSFLRTLSKRPFLS